MKEITAEDRRFMQMAIDLSIENVANGGGPFGAVIVKDGEVVATGVNRVTANNDPTAHAEVSAIRAACQKIQDFRLTDCTCYTSCEPCPMCLGACLWANIKEIRYGCNRKDTADIGFRDDIFYDYIYGKSDILSLVETGREECRKLFADYKDDPDSLRY